MPSLSRLKQRRLSDFFQKVSDDIDWDGQSLLYVAANHPFIYTIGNATADLPELIVFGPQGVAYVLNVVSEMQRKNGAAFGHGDRVMVETDLGDYPVMIAKVNEVIIRDEYTVQTGQFLEREDYAVQQVVLCDVNRKFPNEPGYIGWCQTLFNA